MPHYYCLNACNSATSVCFPSLCHGSLAVWSPPPQHGTPLPDTQLSEEYWFHLLSLTGGMWILVEKLRTVFCFSCLAHCVLLLKAQMCDLSSPEEEARYQWYSFNQQPQKAAKEQFCPTYTAQGAGPCVRDLILLFYMQGWFVLKHKPPSLLQCCRCHQWQTCCFHVGLHSELLPELHPAKSRFSSSCDSRTTPKHVH